jgi:crotonobetainyl-CoA:carnitine CoA-transferase CaiB-like acyl-CoA transferase
MAGPLAGIKVIDISAVISGPMCCQILADQGAEVIKVEPHGIGDITRIGGFRVGSISAMYAAANRGKRSVALDVSQPAGIEAFKALVKDADVLVQNFRPGAVERMGIGPDDLRAINPKLIYVSISGFGPTGPYANWRVYDPIIQAVVGLPSIQMSQDIPIPDLVRTLACDKATAYTAAQSITAALFARAMGTAAGQHLEITMLDSALYFLWPDVFMTHSFDGPDVIPGPAIYQVYRLQQTADGYLVYFAASNAEWLGLATALGHPEWMDDERFNTPQNRQVPEHLVVLGSMVNDAFLDCPTAEVMVRLHAEQVPAAHINTLDEVFSDPQVVNNGSIHTWHHPTVGQVRQARPPVKWSDTAHDPVWAFDELGQSTVAVLREHGYDDASLADLRAAGVIS